MKSKVKQNQHEMEVPKDISMKYLRDLLKKYDKRHCKTSV